MDFSTPADYIVKVKEGKKLDKNLGFARELKKFVGHECVGDAARIWCPKKFFKYLEKESMNWRLEEEFKPFSSIKIG